MRPPANSHAREPSWKQLFQVVGQATQVKPLDYYSPKTKEISCSSSNFCPLIVASMNESCLQKLCGLYLMAIFYDRFSIYMNPLEFFCKEEPSLPSRLFSWFLLIYQYGFMNTYFIERTTNPIPLSFTILIKMVQFWQVGATSGYSLKFFQQVFILLWALAYFLAPQDAPSLACIFLALALKPTTSPRGLNSLDWGMAFRNQDLSVVCSLLRGCHCF